MTNLLPIPESWLSDPPGTLVIGECSYARALTLVLGAGSISPEKLLAGSEEAPEGGVPQVIGGLERVIFVVGASESAADILGCHAALWRWIEKLSPEGEHHEVVILFVLPPSSSDTLAESLAVGLGLEKLDSESGHGVARMGDSLESLFRMLAAICARDFPPLRARQAGNVRHKAIRQLSASASLEEFVNSVQAVAAAFKGQEYHLDLFCRPPGHRNGNALRQWLREAVSEGVHSEKFASVKSSLASWLRDG